ncbi:tRNA (adenosine(37)-N6)-threonylcarbamoyltransferase complex ATPase subunit type 1 TsaE [Tateyamaria sp. SN6-1]|uniref:tRNA (adenosine(37)-N6)-threonylcarbamoyltransferase complex ATPase subunit type 1 TsaE n=1 Tax=Tateyamaria sp. SN6-1 TaxID=3092148 RepID=UPI0039F4D4F9
MSTSPITLNLPDADATAALGRSLAAHLVPGDILLLEGDVGAGKTHLARALIQSILIEAEDVPSPTFTLVQVYDTTRGPLWHADLYRLSDSSEVEELGLTEAFATAICLVEWPDRLADTPAGALRLCIHPSGAGRSVELSWQSERWATRMKQGIAHD